MLNYEQLFADSRLWSALSHNLIWIMFWARWRRWRSALFLGVLLWRGVRGMVFFRTVYFYAGGAGSGRGRHHLEVDVQSALWSHQCDAEGV